MTINNSSETRLKRELYHAYRTGWRDGVNSRVKDVRYVSHPTRSDLTKQYDRGYQAARDTVAVHFMKEAERLGHNPSMDLLRSDPALEPESLGWIPCDHPYTDCQSCKGTGIFDDYPCSSCVWRHWVEENKDNLCMPEEIDAGRAEL